MPNRNPVSLPPPKPRNRVSIRAKHEGNNDINPVGAKHPGGYVIAKNQQPITGMQRRPLHNTRAKHEGNKFLVLSERFFALMLRPYENARGQGE